jgi:hypothetical protein
VIGTVLTIELPGPLWMWAALLALWMISAAVNLLMDARITYWRHQLEKKRAEHPDG